MSTQNKDTVCLVGIFKAPPHLSKLQLENKLEAVVDTCLALPGITRGLLKYEMNITLDDHIQALGLPAPHPTVLLRAEWETLDQVVEILSDATIQKLTTGLIKELGVDMDICAFSADVVTKIKRTK
ncbi:hypothetical protein FB451DRAFT_1189882 [Mycena latifolia]|nr:hypothetical protein FB451DRAFT_1189882 [Mycena latifolia]